MGRSDDCSSKCSLWASSNRSSRPAGGRLHTDITPQSSQHRSPHRVPAHEERRTSTLEEHQLPGHREYWRTVMGPSGSDTHPSSSSHHGSRSRNQETERAHTGGTGSMRRGTPILEGAQGGEHRRTRQPSTTTARVFDLSCTSCGTTFSTPAQLASHVEAYHQSSRPHTCERCGMTFSQKSHMKQHMRTVHDKYRPFRCEICHREFGKRYDLSSHENAVHGNVKEHECQLCGRAFAKRSNLNRHVANVHQQAGGGSSSGSSGHQQPPPP